MRLRFTVILLFISLLSIVSSVAQEGTSGYRVIDVIELDAMSGPAHTATFLSPDGQSYAHFSGQTVCIYTLPENEEDSCYELDDNIFVELESVRWSPDSQYLAFVDNDAMRRFQDTDIQVLDLESREIRNITDDGYDENFGMQENEGESIHVDIALAWSDDNQLAVLRYSIENGESRPEGTTVTLVDPASGEADDLIKIPTEQAFLHFTLAWSGDRIALGRFPARNDDGIEGIDIINVNSGEVEEVIPVSEHLATIYSLQFSAANDYLLVYNSRIRANGLMLRPDAMEMDGVGIIDLSSGEEVVVDSEHFVTQAGFSPDGEAIAYTTYMHPEQMEGGLYITSAPGETGEVVLGDINLDGTSPYSVANLTWASNNTILVRDNETWNAMLIILEVID